MRKAAIYFCTTCIVIVTGISPPYSQLFGDPVNYDAAENPISVFAADPDGNCVPLELSDVVTEIAAYKGAGQTSGCPDCPGSRRCPA